MKKLVKEFIQNQRLKKIVIMDTFELLKEQSNDANIYSFIIVEGAYCNIINYWIIVVECKIHM